MRRAEIVREGAGVVASTAGLSILAGIFFGGDQDFRFLILDLVLVLFALSGGCLIGAVWLISPLWRRR